MITAVHMNRNLCILLAGMASAVYLPPVHCQKLVSVIWEECSTCGTATGQLQCMTSVDVS